MSANQRTYFHIFTACLVGSLAAFVFLNLLVDPMGAYPAFALKKFQPWRERVTSRIAKAELITHGDCEVLILGSSRMLVGIPVDDPAYGTSHVYNLGLNATTFTETSAVFEHALRYNHIKRVLLGADFLLFSDVRGDSHAFESSRFNPDLNRFDYYCRILLGEQSIGQSFSLLSDELRHKPPLPGERGFAPKTIPRGQSQRDIFAARIRGFLIDPESYGAFHYSSGRLDLFRKMVQRCRKDGIELIVFIPPVHALQLETIRAAGLWQTFERWKGDLIHILAEESAPNVTPLWDFTGFNGQVAEEVPPSGDTTTRMKYYLESSHFKPDLGRLALQRILSRNEGDGTFGVPLTRSNLENHLDQLRLDREVYARTHADEIAWVNQIAASAKGKTAAANDF